MAGPNRIVSGMMNRRLTTLNELDSIISQLEQQKDAIDRALSALREVEGNTMPMASRAGRPRRKFSAATRRKMALSQRRRYAALRGKDGTAGDASKPKKPAKRKISAEGMANIRAALKRRWAAARKQAARGKKTAVAKKAGAAKQSAATKKTANRKGNAAMKAGTSAPAEATPAS